MNKETKKDNSETEKDNSETEKYEEQIKLFQNASNIIESMMINTHNSKEYHCSFSLSIKDKPRKYFDFSYKSPMKMLGIMWEISENIGVDKLLSLMNGGIFSIFNSNIEQSLTLLLKIQPLNIHTEVEVTPKTIDSAPSFDTYFLNNKYEAIFVCNAYLYHSFIPYLEIFCKKKITGK